MSIQVASLNNTTERRLRASLTVDVASVLEGIFLKNDEFLVTDFSAFCVVIMVPFLFVTSRGSGLKGVDIWICLGLCSLQRLYDKKQPVSCELQRHDFIMPSATCPLLDTAQLEASGHNGETHALLSTMKTTLSIGQREIVYNNKSGYTKKWKRQVKRLFGINCVVDSEHGLCSYTNNII
ncbi:hypothetical protein P5673_014139 [Acropora cervicornis]|uniref:Uncharacterized protein n=1 Tax=Acropora cervicornis TaxID=6130 RepID=A0AAD9V6F9_ACRCE|nr:hypothetical protein P5673_014139 [Acropora cervicornis]